MRRGPQEMNAGRRRMGLGRRRGLYASCRPMPRKQFAGRSTRLDDGEFALTMDNGAPLRVENPRRSRMPDRPSSISPAPATAAGREFQRAAGRHPRRCALRLPLPGGEEIPLNDGCLKPLHILIPPGRFLSPRLVRRWSPAIPRSARRCAMCCSARSASLPRPRHDEQLSLRRCAPPVLRDDLRRAVPETPGGEGFDGAAVQAHMTNTRMTDPEVLELRYPVRLDGFFDPARIWWRRRMARR